jgi:hypothetical protein
MCLPVHVETPPGTTISDGFSDFKLMRIFDSVDSLSTNLQRPVTVRSSMLRIAISTGTAGSLYDTAFTRDLSRDNLLVAHQKSSLDYIVCSEHH